MDSNLFKTKSIEQLVGDVEHGGKALRRSLTALDLTLLGIGAIIGTGIFVLTGTAAANQAGPGDHAVVSGCGPGVRVRGALLRGVRVDDPDRRQRLHLRLRDARRAGRVDDRLGPDPRIRGRLDDRGDRLERLHAAAARRSSASPLPAGDRRAPPDGIINLPAVIIVLLIMVLLVVGVRESARFNAAMVAIKLVAVLFFLAVGVAYVEPANWQPFAPYGWPGVMAAAAVVFFAYIGFDAVSTTAEEAKNPQRDLPIGIIASLVICTVLYLAVGLVLSGIVPVIQFRSLEGALPGVPLVDQAESIKFLNAPVAYALAFINQGWAAGLVSAGAVAGITSVLLVMLMSQPRIFFSMSRDRLLPQGVSKVHPRFGTPYITTAITCVIVALVAGLTQIQVVGEMTSIGTLFAFVVVCAAVLVLRAKPSRCEAAVQGAVRSDLPDPRHPVVLVPDAQPAGPHLGSLPGVARHRHGHLLVLRPHAQPAGQQQRSKRADADADPGELHQHLRTAADLQRRVHRDPRLLHRVGHHERDHREVGGDWRDGGPGRRVRPEVPGRRRSRSGSSASA